MYWGGLGISLPSIAYSRASAMRKFLRNRGGCVVGVDRLGNNCAPRDKVLWLLRKYDRVGYIAGTNRSPQPRQVTIVTGLLPDEKGHLAGMASTVDAAQASLAPAGWGLSWIVIIDGRGALPQVELPKGTKLERMADHAGRTACLNRAASLCHPSWVMALYPGDTLVAGGLCDLLTEPVLRGVKWCGGKVVLVGNRGTETVSTVTPREWKRYELAENWTIPFAYHPATLIVRSQILLAAGGWPALTGSENLGLALNVSDLADGVVTAHTILRRQLPVVTARSQGRRAVNRQSAFATITAVLSARRSLEGMPGISPPKAARISPPNGALPA